MFHVRRLITQTNLSLVKQSAKSESIFSHSLKNKTVYSLIILFHRSLIKPASYSTTSGIDLEQIIRIDHTETPELRKIFISESCIKVGTVLKIAKFLFQKTN